jgi:lycopene cyclase domain-containing protein
MKEYTLLAAISLVLVLWMDNATGVRILRRKGYYLYLAVILAFKLLVNGYLTRENIVRYNPDFFLGVRLGSIPLEDFIFGFSMVSCTIILWEYFLRRIK